MDRMLLWWRFGDLWDACDDVGWIGKQQYEQHSGPSHCVCGDLCPHSRTTPAAHLDPLFRSIDARLVTRWSPDLILSLFFHHLCPSSNFRTVLMFIFNFHSVQIVDSEKQSKMSQSLIVWLSSRPMWGTLVLLGQLTWSDVWINEINDIKGLLIRFPKNNTQKLFSDKRINSKTSQRFPHFCKHDLFIWLNQSFCKSKPKVGILLRRTLIIQICTKPDMKKNDKHCTSGLCVKPSVTCGHS